MTDKTMLNFRCPAEILDAIDAIGQERYPSETAKHGCDRTKTLLDIVRAGIVALSEKPTVLRGSDASVRQNKTELLTHTEELPGKSEFRLDDSVQAALVDVEDAKKHAQIYGFNPDEALADAYFRVNMLTSNYDEFEDRHEALKKELAIANQKVSDRDEEIERLESELEQRSEQIAAPIAIELPEPATLLNQLKAKRKKSKCDLADVEAILDMLGSLLP